MFIYIFISLSHFIYIYIEKWSDDIDDMDDVDNNNIEDTK